MKINVFPDTETEIRTISPSQLRSWTYCPTQWDYAYNKDVSKSMQRKYFDVGNYFHELLHVLYQTIKSNPKVPLEFLQEMITTRVKRDLIGDNLEVVNIVLPKILRYISYQMPIIDKNIQVLQVEYEYKVPVLTPAGNEIILHGIVDLLYKDSQGNIRIRDHKTGARSYHSQDSVKLDDQLQFYFVALNEMYPQTKIMDVEISFINSYVYKTKIPAASEMFKLYRYQHNPAGLALARDNLLRRIDLMLDTAVVRNYSPNCAGCAYFDVCSMEMRGLSTVGIIANNYEVGRRSARNSAKPPPETQVAEEHANGN